MTIKTYFKADTEKVEVREVTGEGWPGRDSEGGEIYTNKHYGTRAEAIEHLCKDSLARISLAAAQVKSAEDALQRARIETAAACAQMARFMEYVKD